MLDQKETKFLRPLGRRQLHRVRAELKNRLSRKGRERPDRDQVRGRRCGIHIEEGAFIARGERDGSFVAEDKCSAAPAFQDRAAVFERVVGKRNGHPAHSEH